MGWKCNVCGYVHEGDEPPETCPVCGVPASEFTSLNSAPDIGGVKRWRCTVCGYIHEAPEIPDPCPVCGAPATVFEGAGASVGSTPAPAAEEKKTVADVMVETMINWGVTHVFGMVGHSNLGLAEAIRKQCESGKLNYIGVRHEGAASFAASAYGKLTGRPAACLAIAGPGATNLLTGLWDARMDRIPILALTGQIDTQVLGKISLERAMPFRPGGKVSNRPALQFRKVRLTRKRRF